MRENRRAPEGGCANRFNSASCRSGKAGAETCPRSRSRFQARATTACRSAQARARWRQARGSGCAS